LGKRSKNKELNLEEDENIVLKVEQQEQNAVKPKKETNIDELPKSIKDSEREKNKLKRPKKSSSSGQATNEEEKEKSKKKVEDMSQKWANIYESAQEPIKKMIEDHGNEKSSKSKEKKGNKSKGKSKYYLGSAMSDIKQSKN